MSLTAHHLESNGIPTVVVGSAKDIVEHCGVPRFLFVDFPLGNPMGAPYNRKMQLEISRLAVQLLEQATEHGTIKRAPFEWPGDPDWRAIYNRVNDSNAASLKALGERRRDYRRALPKRDI